MSQPFLLLSVFRLGNRTDYYDSKRQPREIREAASRQPPAAGATHAEWLSPQIAGGKKHIRILQHRHRMSKRQNVACQ